MSYYKYLKKHTSLAETYIIAGILLFFYFVTILNAANIQLAKLRVGLISAPTEIPFHANFMLWLIYLGCILELNQKLFWVKEQGKQIFILQKYDTLPISRSALYQARARLMVRTSALYIGWTVVLYYIAIFINLTTRTVWFPPILSIIKTIFLCMLFLIFILIVDYLQDTNARQYPFLSLFSQAAKETVLDGD